MSTFRSLSFLRRVLVLDAVASGAMGIALLLFGSALASILRIPAELLADAGRVLMPFVALVGFLASRREPNRIAVWAVIVLNAIWVIDSVLLLAAGWIEPNALGYVFVLGQALVVAVFAELQYVGLRRSTAMLPSS